MRSPEVDSCRPNLWAVASGASRRRPSLRHAGRAARRVRSAGLTGLIGLAGLLGSMACSSDAEVSTVDASSEAPWSTGSPAERIDAVLADESIVDPIGALLGSKSDLVPDRDVIEDAEQEVADCMAAAGFDYLGTSLAEVFDEARVIAGGPDELSREYAVEHGYGIADNTVAMHVTETTVVAGDGLGAATTSTLRPPEEQSAYDAALYGADALELIAGTSQAGRADGSPLPTADDDIERGCLAAGYAVWNEELEPLNRLFELIGLFDLEREIGDAIDARELDDAANEWVECMDGKGYDYEDPDEARETTMAAADELVFGSADPDDPGGPITGDRSQAAIDEIRAVETQVAVDDWDCGEAMRATADETRRRVSVEVIEEHRAAFEEYLETAGS